LTFTFEDLDEHTWLVISIGSESLLLLGWDSCVSWDEDGHNFTGSLNTLGEWSDIEKKQVFYVLTSFSREDGSLDGGTIGNGLIWVN